LDKGVLWIKALRKEEKDKSRSFRIEKRKALLLPLPSPAILMRANSQMPPAKRAF
jgi:hypothetical protein